MPKPMTNHAAIPAAPLPPGDLFNYLGLDPYAAHKRQHQQQTWTNAHGRTLRLLLHPDKTKTSADAARAQSRDGGLGLSFVTLRRIEEWLARGEADGLLQREAGKIVRGGLRWMSTWNPHGVDGGALFEPLPSWTLKMKMKRVAIDLCALPPPPIRSTSWFHVPLFDGSDCDEPLEAGEGTSELLELGEAMVDNTNKVSVAIAFLDCGLTKGCTAVAVAEEVGDGFVVHLYDSQRRRVDTVAMAQLLAGGGDLEYVNFQGVFRMMPGEVLGEYVRLFLAAVGGARTAW